MLLVKQHAIPSLLASQLAKPAIFIQKNSPSHTTKSHYELILKINRRQTWRNENFSKLIYGKNKR